jgi:hypothetical protein
MWIVLMQLPNLHSRELMRSPRRAEAEAYAASMRRKMRVEVIVMWEEPCQSEQAA